MNDRIGRLYVLLALGFALLVGAVTYWQIWAAPGLATRRDNARLVFRELSIDRGRILSIDGVVLARNRRRESNGRTIFVREYPQGGLAAQWVGYSTVRESRTGLEESLNGWLTGANTDLTGGLERLAEQVTGGQVRGNDVVLALSARAQGVALRALRATGRPGAVVALDPQTGAVRVMASNPTFDPNEPARSFDAAGAPLLDRGTQGLYPPGSTFKVVTAASALDRGDVTPETVFPGPACIRTQGPRLCNFRGEEPGRHDFRTALVESVNTTFAELGRRVGASGLVATMDAFGFGSRFDIDYPADQVARSGLYGPGGKPLDAGAGIDVERTAIGQGRLLATPLQMALVAAAVANGGMLITPQPVAEVRDPDGRVVERPGARTIGRAMTPETAATLRTIMRSVVDDGTGRAANLEGLSIAGKTGTAETGRDDRNDAWFIAFAPAERPTVAIAVVVEETDQTGGTLAAPIAAEVIGALTGAA